MADPTPIPKAETDPWGIESGFKDALEVWRETPPDVRDALRRAMGPLEGPLEAGSAVPEGLARPDSRAGKPAGPAETPLRCQPPPARRSWGWAVQLYSVRSAESWGIGDLADLRRLGAWSANLGARFLQVNPLMANQPVPPIEASPYFPSTRRFLNPIYLRIDEVPGAEGAATELRELSERARTLNAADLIDRDAVFRLKQEALALLWTRTGDNRELDRFAAERGPGLAEFATFCVLAETHGPDWRAWPTELRNPASPAVARFAEVRRERVAFHQWVQWLLDNQLRNAAEAIPLLQDLPIGFDPGGADAWAWQDLLAGEAVVGAPPDAFNTHGQDWGLPPFIPHKLRAAGYAPLRDTLRAVLRHAGGLRVDHVMGLFRLYWIPKGFPPSRGAYVRYPHKEMLDMVAEESRRAKAYVVGEDLGTVEPEAREAMAKRGILGSKVFWFETEPPYAWPTNTMASISTHDLPTLAGLWTGADAAEQRALGLSANADSMQPMLRRLRGMAGVGQKADSREAVRRVHRLLSEASSALIAGTLEDALAVERRPNLPGTVLERPNWRIPLPFSLEQIETHPLVLEVAARLDRRP